MDEEASLLPGARRLISGTVVLFVARLATAGLALVQVMLLAAKFGASASTDAYFVASALALMFAGPIEIALNMAFPPVLVHAAETDGQDAAWKIAAGLFRAGLLATAAVAAVFVALSPWIAGLLAPGFDEASRAQVAQIVRITAPVILFVYAAAFLSTLDFIEGRSLLPSAGMFVSALGGPIALLWFADRYGVVTVAWGTLAGAVARCLVQLRVGQMRRLLGPGVPLRDPIMRRIAGMMVSRLLTTWFLELNMTVDRVFASLLGPGYISALTYASRAIITVMRVFLTPMGRMLLPPLSRMAARGQYDRMRELTEKLVVATAFVLVPLVAFIVGFRMELLRFVFGRGAFDVAAAQATSVALVFYALGIIPFLVAPLLSGGFFALQDSDTPLRVGLVCVVANAVLDAILVLGLGHGGIALATSLVGAVRALLLWIYLGRRIGRLRSWSVLGSLLVSAATAVVAFWGARLVVSHTGPGWSDSLWRLAASGLIGGMGYLLLQNLFNRPVVRLLPAVLGRVGAVRT